MDESVKCLNSKCKHNRWCHRFKSRPKPYGQTYIVNTRFDEKGNCEFYLEVKPRKLGTKFGA